MLASMTVLIAIYGDMRNEYNLALWPDNIVRPLLGDKLENLTRPRCPIERDKQLRETRTLKAVSRKVTFILNQLKAAKILGTTHIKGIS